MKNLLYFLKIALTAACIPFLSSCEKFLDENPNKQLTLPSDKIENLQLLLDNTTVMNTNIPSAGEIASDNIFIGQTEWDFLASIQRTSSNLYIWQPDVFNDNDLNDWSVNYAKIFTANIVLESIDKLQHGNPVLANNIKGSALFFRSHAFYQLLQQFANDYDKNTANIDKGIVLKLSPDINEKLARASVQECYEKVFSDLRSAAALLPLTPAFKTRPSKTAAWALLARGYLQAGDYSNARQFADSCITAYPGLIDYNTLSSTAAYPLARFNPEVIWHGTMLLYTSLAYPYGRAHPELYNMYNANDLRKGIFFKVNGTNDIAFKGSYDGALTLFSGISSNEMYLISAECSARLNDIPKALDRLNTLLDKRWKRGTFVPVVSGNQEQILTRVLEERRRELPFRNMRWSDLKRMNKDDRFKKSITRNLNNRTYVLEPNSPAYLFPLPEKARILGGL